jgi:PAS domain S-box-containing protein
MNMRTTHESSEKKLKHQRLRSFVPSPDTRSEHAETRSEQVIHASELSYRRLFETARDGILILDAGTGRISDVNPFLVELLGFSHDEMVGKTVGELSPFKDIESNKVMLGRLQKDGYVRYEDLPLETRDGRRIAVEFVSNVYQAGNHNVIQCNVRNITERKKVEAALIRLASIVESSDDAIIGKDLDGIITNWNKGAEKIFGYTAGEIVGTSVLRLIPSDRLQEEDQILGKIRRGERVEHFETLRQAKDGRLINVSVTTSAIRDATCKVTGVSKVARDITARKAAEGKILQLNLELEQRVVERTAELQAANHELEAFSYSVSHDLRAPLRHVTGFVSLLQNKAGPSLSEENLSLLTDISAAAARMGVLIDDLLAFSRVGKSEMRKTNVNLDDLVRETLGDFAAETKLRKIDWKIGPLPHVWADRALLRMALVNLFSNAMKFTGARDQARIEISRLPSRDGETVISIRDNGAGFDPQYADKLFGVFQRLHDRDEFEGTGIGLANVQRIIQRHGGRTWAEGMVDSGATFFFSLPKQNRGANGH